MFSRCRIHVVHCCGVPNTKAATHRPLPEPLADNLAQALRERREQAGLTQEALAGAASVSVQMIRRLEAAAANPTLGTLHAITTALGTTLANLLKEAGA